MREAAQAIISYGFGEARLHRIEAVVNGGNEPSKTSEPVEKGPYRC